MKKLIASLIIGFAGLCLFGTVASAKAVVDTAAPEVPGCCQWCPTYGGGMYCCGMHNC